MYYDGKNKAFAKSLRKNMTPWEKKLWYCFLKTYPVRFQRQKQIENYIVDFFCARAGLILELDGGGHYDPQTQKKDEERSIKLESHGYKVIRFCNRDIDKNFYSVCTVIDREVKQRTLPQSPPMAVPHSLVVRLPLAIVNLNRFATLREGAKAHYQA